MRTVLAFAIGLGTGLAAGVLLLILTPDRPAPADPDQRREETADVAEAREHIAHLESEMSRLRAELARSAPAPLAPRPPPTPEEEPPEESPPLPLPAPVPADPGSQLTSDRLLIEGTLDGLPIEVTPDEVRRLLTSRDPRDQVRGLRVLDQLPPQEALGLARVILADAAGLPWLRMTALRAISELETPGTARAIAGVLQESSAPWLVATAADTLGRLGDPEAVPTLQEAYRRSDGRLQLTMALALRRLGDPEPARDVAARALGDLTNQDGGLRAAAVRTLAALEDPAHNVHLTEALGDPSSDVRQTAAQALGAQGTLEDLPALQNLLSDPVERVVHAAERAIHLIQHPQERQANRGPRVIRGF